MKKMLALLLLLLSLSPLSLAEDSALTLDELYTWADELKAKAMQSAPENDPNDPRANTQDGYLFKYDFATLYMDRPEMTEDAVLLEAVIPDMSEYPGPRGTHIDHMTNDVLSAYYCENEMLDGTHDFAVLYLSNTMPSGALWAWVMRDGQRVQAIQYAIHDQLTTGGDGYTDTGVVYTIQNDLVAAIRVYGLNDRITREDVEHNITEVQELADSHGYTRAFTSTNGKLLEPFNENDLSFSDIGFLTTTPEHAQALFGTALEDVWFQDDTGDWLRIMEFSTCSLTFTYDQQKKNPVLSMISVNRDGLEGPRCIRFGDSFSSVLNRFRNGDGEYDAENMSEILYGTPDSANWGEANYFNDASAQILMTTTIANGRRVSLYIIFEMMNLSEYIVYYNN